MSTGFNPRNTFHWIPLGIIGGLGLLALGGWVVMRLWNHILPGLIPGVGYLTFYKAVGLLLLSKILFGGFRGRLPRQAALEGKDDAHERRRTTTRQRRVETTLQAIKNITLFLNPSIFSHFTLHFSRYAQFNSISFTFRLFL